MPRPLPGPTRFALVALAVVLTATCSIERSGLGTRGRPAVDGAAGPMDAGSDGARPDMDAGVPDAGGDAPDGGPTDARSEDAGRTECPAGSSCTCGDGETCTCVGGGGCGFDCTGDCVIECPAGGCVVECANSEETDCDVSCAGGGCVQNGCDDSSCSCMPASSCVCESSCE